MGIMNAKNAKTLRRALEYADSDDARKITNTYGVGYLDALEAIGYIIINLNCELTAFGRVTLNRLRADEWKPID